MYRLCIADFSKVALSLHQLTGKEKSLNGLIFAKSFESQIE